MWTTRSDAAPRGIPVAAGLILSLWLVLSLVLSACSVGGDEPDPGPGPDGTTAEIAGPDVVRGLERALARRATAVRDADETSFAAGVDPRRAAFATRQRTWFDNLTGLPVAHLGYRLDPSSLERDGADWWATVEVSVQLDGYDAHPVTTTDRYRFTRQGGRFVMTAARHPHPQPWDVGAITAVTGVGVLGIFDAGSIAGAAAVVADVERGLADVAGTVPYPAPASVVVVALSDPAYLAGLEDVPGGDPLALDAVSVRLPRAGTRVVLSPGMVAAPGPARSRLLRHELVHVVLGARADGAPTWLSEGLAEYVSVRPIAPAERVISGEALAAAEAGPRSLPADAAFHGEGHEASYGLAWWACEYLAATYGEPILWHLLEEVTASPDPDEALRDLLGIEGEELAARAARLLLATYRPDSS